MKISFIGFGNIAQAMAKCLVNHEGYELQAASPSLQIGMNADNIYTHHDNLAILNGADVVILAVKPINVTKVLTQIKLAIPPNCLLISVAAGLSLSWLEKQSAENQAIVRAMPNTPISVGKGATPLIANQFVRIEKKELVSQLFQCMGIITWLNDEKDMDIFTALSGSGPGYVFLFLEAMINAAEKLGLERPLAKEFAIQTLSGSVELASISKLEVRELRQKVTSPGGTTAAAIHILETEKFEQILFDAMKAALDRANEFEK